MANVYIRKCVAATRTYVQCIIINKIIITVLVSLSHVCCVKHYIAVYNGKKFCFWWESISFFLSLSMRDSRCRVIYRLTHSLNQLFIFLVLLIFVLMAEICVISIYLIILAGNDLLRFIIIIIIGRPLLLHHLLLMCIK